jgi:hypothetical protein
MGMPITTFSVLHTLAYEQGDSQFLRALRPFKLFAFIVHDPQVDVDFDKFLQNHFDRLDYVTGSKLLFFALVRPRLSWSERAINRGYYRNFLNWQPVESSSSDSSSSAISFAASLNIPVESLPCLIITDNLQSQRMIWFKTSKECLEEQMTSLGYMADRTQNPMLPDSVQNEQLDLCASSGREELADNLAQTLSDVLSVLAAKARPYRDYSAQSRAHQAVEKSLSAIRNWKLNVGESTSAEVEDSNDQGLVSLCLKSLGLFSLGVSRPETDDIAVFDRIRTMESRVEDFSATPSLGDLRSEFPSIDGSLLESESKQILETAKRVHSLFFDYPAQLNDFTPLVICLAKLFEREVNLSVVHWIRRELGIELPRFFDKPQPHFLARLLPDVPNPREIDFNRAGAAGTRWIAPSLGESGIGARTIGRNKLPDGLTVNTWNTLMIEWRQIAKRRNEAAHEMRVNLNAASDVYRSLRIVGHSKLFNEMYRLKCLYRGRNPVQ